MPLFPQIPDILSRRDITPGDLLPAKLSETLLRVYAWMQLARATDNRILQLFRQGLIKGTVTGGQGNEPLVASLALLADKSTDVVSFTHRGLAGHLIWSGHLCDHLNQYFANASSPTQAREGNVHHGDPANRSFPMVSHLGAMVSTVIGATHSQIRAGALAIGITFFGDGASSTGDIHESLNLASLLQIPVLFVIENNSYAYSTPTAEQFPDNIQLHQRAAAYGIPSAVIDTTNPDLSATLTQINDAIQQVRTTRRPFLIEAKTLRLNGHAAYDTCDYLTPEAVAQTIAADPLPKYRQLLQQQNPAALAQLETTLNDFIETSVKTSLEIPRPQPNPELHQADVFAPAAPPIAWQPNIPAGTSTAPITMAQAINAALKKILSERPESFILGQDIATYGGPFKVTENLYKQFGRDRVLNTPVAESACTGYAIGHAANKHRPIEEFQFADFVTEAFTQITQNASTWHYRSGAKLPLVFRLPCGGGLTMGSFHSQELESPLLSFPGLKALYPSTPQDAFNALLAAYEDDNPVLIFEHKSLYRRQKQAIQWDPDYRSIWQPKQLHTGTRATLLTYGEMTHHAIAAAQTLASEYDITIDLFDLRALSPLNLDPIKTSLQKTHRLAVLHEARANLGFASEIITRLLTENFFEMEAPPLRIASLDTPVPFAPELESAFRPNTDLILNKLLPWLA